MMLLWKRLGELAMPVQLIVGEGDARFRAIRRADGKPGGDFRTPRPHGDPPALAGHAVHLEPAGQTPLRITVIAEN